MTEPAMEGINRVLTRISEIRRRYDGSEELANRRFIDVLSDVAQERASRASLAIAELRKIAAAKAEHYNIDEELIRAMIQVESGWRQDAVSHKGASGLMQLMPATASMLGVDDPFDAEQNVEGGVKYLAQLLRRYGGDVEKALAAYNSGPSRVDAGTLPSETQKYVRNVMALYRRYREED